MKIKLNRLYQGRPLQNAIVDYLNSNGFYHTSQIKIDDDKIARTILKTAPTISQIRNGDGLTPLDELTLAIEDSYPIILDLATNIDEIFENFVGIKIKE